MRRLSKGSPSDKLSKAFTQLGRILKTECILQYITDSDLYELLLRGFAMPFLKRNFMGLFRKESRFDFTLKLLSKKDYTDVLALFERSSSFFKLVYGEDNAGEEAKNIFTDCPKGKMLTDKLLVGIYEKKFTLPSTLIGLLELIKDYPHLNCWYIGLLLIDPAYRGQKISSNVLQMLEKTIKIFSGNELKFVVQIQNTEAVTFWKNSGYSIEKKSIQKLPTSENVILHMCKKF